MTQFRITAIFTLCFIAHLLHAEVVFSARFSPETIAKGQQANYIITLTESSTKAPPQIERFETLPIGPTIGGLEFRRGGWGGESRKQSSDFSGNRYFESSVELRVEVVTSGLGEFTVPAYRINYKGTEYTIPSASLTVVERRNEPSSDEQVFLSIDAPEAMFVGQTINITANLYVHERVSRVEYHSSELEGDGFIINNTEATPSSSVATINGRRYQLLQWPLTVTAIQQGAEQQLSATAILAQTRFITQQRVPVTADPVFINVLPLPSEGKPNSFSGAIGDFQMEVSTDLDSTKTGEPIMLSLKLSGEGNFERIQGPKLQESRDWKVYAPESQMEDGARSASKRFDYVMIPKRTGMLKTPEVAFSFFDPENSEYVEYTSPSLEIQVTQGRQQYQPSTPTANESNEAEQSVQQDLSRALTPEEALLTLDYRPKPARTISADNPFTSTTFVLLNAAGLILVSLLTCRARQARRLRTDADYALQHACGKELKVARHNAATADSAEQFYQQAQAAIRLAVSKKTQRNLRNAELNELLRYVPKDAHTARVTAIFTQADAIRFSARSNSDDWKAQQAQLDSLLKAL